MNQESTLMEHYWRTIIRNSLLALGTHSGSLDHSACSFHDCSGSNPCQSCHTILQTRIQQLPDSVHSEKSEQNESKSMLVWVCPLFHMLEQEHDDRNPCRMVLPMRKEPWQGKKAEGH